MARKQYSGKDCLKLLREIELRLAGGADVPMACRAAGISDATEGGRIDFELVAALKKGVWVDDELQPLDKGHAAGITAQQRGPCAGFEDDWDER